MPNQTQRPGHTAQAVPHLTVDERIRRGKEARARAPRSSLAEFTAGPDRPDPVSLLERQATTRVPELVPVRYGRMLVSPFTFFRGAALVMASDLVATPRSGLTAQVCGDAHLSNFGVFASPERTLMFDVNDFDETLPGPWEWDVERLAASVVIAARDQEFTEKEARLAALEVGTSYRTEMRRLASLSTVDVWYSKIEVATRDYYVRQLRDWKGSVDVEGSIPAGLTKYVGVCAQALARAHARSGDRVAIASYLGNGPTFDRAVADFAETYADQNERDYVAFQAAAASGRISVESGL